MPAPVAALIYSYAFRDAKGQVARMKVIIGDATKAAADADALTLKGHLAAVTNAHVRLIGNDFPDVVRGATAQFQNAEDKLMLLFVGSNGSKHRFRVPAPAATLFMADLETPDNGNANFGALKTDFQTFVYGSPLDTAPLNFVGGLRERSRYIRRYNLLTLDPSLTEPGE